MGSCDREGRRGPMCEGDEEFMAEVAGVGKLAGCSWNVRCGGGWQACSGYLALSSFLFSTIPS